MVIHVCIMCSHMRSVCAHMWLRYDRMGTWTWKSLPWPCTWPTGVAMGTRFRKCCLPRWCHHRRDSWGGAAVIVGHQSPPEIFWMRTRPQPRQASPGHAPGRARQVSLSHRTSARIHCLALSSETMPPLVVLSRDVLHPPIVWAGGQY